jgi:hypothetical protein
MDLHKKRGRKKRVAFRFFRSGGGKYSSSYPQFQIEQTNFHSQFIAKVKIHKPVE